MADKRKPRRDSDSDSDGDSVCIPFINRLKPDSVILDKLQKLTDGTKLASTSKNLTLADPPTCREVTDPGYTKPCELAVLLGNLTFRVNGDMIDCSKGATLEFPDNIDGVGDMSTDDALFIILVQLETYYVLIQDRFNKRFPCIIVALNDQPDIATRLFLTKMQVELKLPVLALVDCDPLALKFLSATPDIKWMGLRPTDLDNYKIPKASRLLMTKRDIKTVKDMLNEDFVKKNPDWVKELSLMVNSKQKAVIDSLWVFGSKYFSEIYLPFKLQQQDWV